MEFVIEWIAYFGGMGILIAYLIFELRKWEYKEKDKRKKGE